MLGCLESLEMMQVVGQLDVDNMLEMNYRKRMVLEKEHAVLRICSEHQLALIMPT